MQDSNQAISWQASEYLHHEKRAGWFVAYFFGSGLIALALHLLIKDVISTTVVIMMLISVGVLAGRKPKPRQYTIDDNGIDIDGKFFSYRSFKFFSIMNYGAVDSIYLEPIERFMPSISMYFAPEDEEKITNNLGKYLPYREREPDMVEKLVHKIRL